MKFVIQQNCWTYVALQTVTKVLKRLRTHNLSVSKEAITKELPSHQHSTHINDGQYQELQYTGVCFKTQLLSSLTDLLS
jgi:hypothetical protein